MRQLTDILSSRLSRAFEEAGYDGALGTVVFSDRPDLCQFQCNGALAGAKRYKQPPAAIAEAVIEKLCAGEDYPRMFQSAQFCPPGFINLTLRPGFIAGRLNQMLTGPDLGLEKPECPKTIIIDFGGANVAKPLHIGHLRSAIIGESIKRTARLLGHRVIGDVHLGDWGLQMGLVIAEIHSRFPGLSYFREGYDGPWPPPPVTLADLKELYPAASAKSKADREFYDKAKSFTVLLQTGDAGVRALWQYIRDISVRDLEKNYTRLGAEFDLWLGESDAQPFVADIVRGMEESGLAYADGGALIMDVAQPEDKAEVPPIILKKSDGSDIYGTTDVVTIARRVDDYSPDEIWYVVDNRQSLHFTQVFRCAKKSGLAGRANLEHLSIGTMNGADGKPYKTRDGGVMSLEGLLDGIHEAARLRIGETNPGLPEGEKDSIAERAGMAALKFGDLCNHRGKDYIFDLDKFMSFEGKTGTYLLYSVVRINSILNKAGSAGRGEVLPPETPAETDLMLELCGLDAALSASFAGRAPNILCDKAYAIASAFSRFYGETRILGNPDKPRLDSHLSLISLCRDALILLLDCLGIETVEKM